MRSSEKSNVPLFKTISKSNKLLLLEMAHFGNITDLGEELRGNPPLGPKLPKPPPRHPCHAVMDARTEEEIIVWAILNYIFSASGLVLNSVQVYCLSLKRNKLTSHETYLISLSVAEIVRLLFECVFMTAELNGNLKTIGNYMKSALMIVLFISIFHLLTITLDRYVAVTHPLKHHVAVTKKRVCLVCIAIWILPLAALCASYIADIWIKLEEMYFMKITMSLIIASGSLFILLYLGIIYQVKSSQESRSGDNVNGRKPNTKTRRTVQMSALICMIFVVFNFPLAIVELMGACTKWPVLLQLLSCSLDSIVYFWMTKKSKRRRFNRSRTFQKTSSNRQVSTTSDLGSVSYIHGNNRDVHGNFQYVNSSC